MGAGGDGGYVYVLLEPRWNEMKNYIVGTLGTISAYVALIIWNIYLL